MTLRKPLIALGGAPRIPVEDEGTDVCVGNGPLRQPLERGPLWDPLPSTEALGDLPGLRGRCVCPSGVIALSLF